MVEQDDIRFYSIVLFKISTLLLALLLGLQLIRSQLPFPFDINTLFTFEQFVFVFVTLVVTILAFLEGRTLQSAQKGGVKGLTFPVIILYIVGAIGTYFSVIIFLGYNFDNSTTNIYLGYYLLVGTFMIFINAREQIFSRFLKK